MDYKGMIERQLSAWGFSAEEWVADNEYAEARPVAVLGKARPLGEDEDRGLYLDLDEDYELSANVVGSEEFGNLQVAFILTEEGMDRFSGSRVSPDEVELI